MTTTSKTIYFETTSRLNLGHSAYKLGKYEEAIKQYQSAVDNDDEFASLFLARALLDFGKITESNSAYLKGFKRHSNIFKGNFLDQYFSSNNDQKLDLDNFLSKVNTPFSFYIMGYVLSRMGLEDEAVKYLENSIKLDNNLSTAHVELGNALFWQGHSEKAIQSYKEALRIDPNNHEAYLKLGYLYSILRNPSESLELFEKAEELNPNSSQLYMFWGQAIAELHRQEDALLRYERALEIDSNNFMAHYGKGLVYEVLGRKEEAYKQFERALAKNPFYWEAYHKCGNISYGEGMWADAVNCYEKALKLNHRFAFDLGMWAKALMKLNRHEEAQEKLVKEKEAGEAKKEIEQTRMQRMNESDVMFGRKKGGLEGSEKLGTGSAPSDL